MSAVKRRYRGDGSTSSDDVPTSALEADDSAAATLHDEGVPRGVSPELKSLVERCILYFVLDSNLSNRDTGLLEIKRLLFGFFLSDWCKRRILFLAPPTDVIEAAPVLWPDKRLEGENPASYIQRHYAKWIGNGLTRADIRRLDRPLYDALASWLGRKGNELTFDLPTKKMINERKVGREIVINEGPAEQQLRELERITSALRRHVRGGD